MTSRESRIVRMWKNPADDHDHQPDGPVNPAGLMALPVDHGGMAGTLADGTYACCPGGTEEYVSFGCCP